MPSPKEQGFDENEISAGVIFSMGGQRFKVDVSATVTDLTNVPLAPVKQMPKRPTPKKK